MAPAVFLGALFPVIFSFFLLVDTLLAGRTAGRANVASEVAVDLSQNSEVPGAIASFLGSYIPESTMIEFRRSWFDVRSRACLQEVSATK